MAGLMDTVVSAYNISLKPSLLTIADELNLNPIKVRKLLIIAGIYESEIVDEVLQLHKEGKSVPKIKSVTGLSRASVNSYLPHSKIQYKADEISVTAEYVRRNQDRKNAVEMLLQGRNMETI